MSRGGRAGLRHCSAGPQGEEKEGGAGGALSCAICLAS